MPEPTLHPSAHHLSFGDLVKYGQLIAEIITLVEQAKAMSVSAVQLIPDIKFSANNEKFTLSGDANGITLTRTA